MRLTIDLTEEGEHWHARCTEIDLVSVGNSAPKALLRLCADIDTYMSDPTLTWEEAFTNIVDEVKERREKTVVRVERKYGAVTFAIEIPVGGRVSPPKFYIDGCEVAQHHYEMVWRLSTQP